MLGRRAASPPKTPTRSCSCQTNETQTAPQRRTGAPIDYGVANFIHHRRTAKADFLRVPSDVDARHLLRFMQNSWRLPRPGILLQITGSAQGFDLPNAMVPPITQGVVHAAMTANAWIVTGGLDSGVMALVGSAVARHKHKCKGPLLGVAPWRAVRSRDHLEHACGGKVMPAARHRQALPGPQPRRSGQRLRVAPLPVTSRFTEPVSPTPQVYYSSTEPNTKDSAALEPNHSHFLLVDSGQGGRVWGAEFDALERLQMELFTSYACPKVLLVVQGGYGSLEQLLTAQRMGVVAVVAADSGERTPLWPRALALRARFERAARQPSHRHDVRHLLRS